MAIEKNHVSMAAFFINQGFTFNQIINMLERLYPNMSEFDILAAIKRAQSEIEELKSNR